MRIHCISKKCVLYLYQFITRKNVFIGVLTGMAKGVNFRPTLFAYIWGKPCLCTKGTEIFGGDYYDRLVYFV